VVSLRVADGLVKVTLHYLQKLKRYDARVRDRREVCGQAP